MAEPSTPDSTSTEVMRNPAGDSGSGLTGAAVRLAVWATLSLAFVGYLAFGSVGARIWRFGRLHVESRSIAATWRVQGRSLPDVAHQWLIETVFYGAILIFVVGVIVGMRLLLAEPANDFTPVDSDRP